MRASKIYRTVLLFVLAFLFLMPSSVLALSSGGLGILPNRTDQYPDIRSWFVYEVDAGIVINDEAIIRNTSDAPVFVKLEGIDALLTIDGAFSLVSDESKNKDIGTWIELSESEFELGPKESKIVPFTLTVPKNAEVGDHIGGLAVRGTASEPDQSFQSGGTKVGVHIRIGARIYLTVAGDIVRDLNIKKRAFFGKGDRMMFRFTFENKGNIRANLSITEGKIYNIFGLYDEQKDMPIGQIFPNTTSITTFPWPGKEKPLFGPYLAILTIEDTYEKVNPNSTVIIPEVEPVTVWLVTLFVPYTQIAIIVGLLFLIWFIWQFIIWKRLSNLARRPVRKYTVKKGDHLMSVAKNFGAPWKVVAKLNNIKPPYSLDNIKNLYIPDATGSKMDIDAPHFLGFIWKPILKLFKKRPKLDKQLQTKPDFEIIIIDKGDTRKDVEKFTGMKWAEIAKYNKLKKSFRLKTNIELKVPLKKIKYKK